MDQQRLLSAYRAEDGAEDGAGLSLERSMTVQLMQYNDRSQSSIMGLW